MFDIILQAGASVLLDPLTLGLMAIGTLAGLLAGAIPGFTIANLLVLDLNLLYLKTLLLIIKRRLMS